MLPYVIIALVIIALVVFFLLSKKAPEAPATPEPEALKDKPTKAKAPEAKAKEEAKPQKQPATKSPEPVSKPKTEPQPVAAEESEKAKALEVEAAAAPVKEAAPAARVALTPRRDVTSLRKGLAKSRENQGFFGRLKALVVGRKEVDPAIAEEIEEILLTSDVGVKTTEALLGRIKSGLSKGELSDTDAVWQTLRDEARSILSAGEPGAFKLRGKPTVVLMVGVNGAGKTTTIGKLATRLKAEGHTCVLAAGDTFRAAAVQQLIVWGERVGCEVIRGKDGADPGSVILTPSRRRKNLARTLS